MKIGRVQRVPVRELWEREDTGFTVWLEQNVEVLGEVLGLQLSVIEREQAVGPFRVDLVAEDGEGRLVIIENQLEPTNHDHLGKVVTYFANLDAKTAIWVSTDPRHEHVKAVNWLNESTPADQCFYAVLLEAVFIEEGMAAPLFTVIAGPSSEGQAIGNEKKEHADRHLRRLTFWEELLERAKARDVLHHENRQPNTRSYFWAPTGTPGTGWTYHTWVNGKSAVNLYINTGDRHEPKRIFDLLYAARSEIESAFGEPLDWERYDEKTASRIQHKFNGSFQSPEDDWPEIQDELIDCMDRFIASISPHLSNI